MFAGMINANSKYILGGQPMRHEILHIAVEASGLDEDAKLYSYLLSNTEQTDPSRKRPAIIICPGGGYNHTSDREAEPIAMQYLAAGYHDFVLRYHVHPVEYPIALYELAISVKLIRERAEEWNIDPNRIIISGFSAGGHLAGCLAVFWSKEWLSMALHTTKEMIRPNGVILSYPVITSGEFAHRGSFEKLLGTCYDELLSKVSIEQQVNEDTPPIFLWHTYTDQAVPVENSLLLIQALRKFNI